MSDLRERHLVTLRAIMREDVYLAPDWEYRRRDAATARHVSEAVYMLEQYRMVRLEYGGVILLTLRGRAWIAKRCPDVVLDIALQSVA